MQEKLNGYDQHPSSCAVHVGYPLPWGQGCDCGLTSGLTKLEPGRRAVFSFNPPGCTCEPQAATLTLDVVAVDAYGVTGYSVPWDSGAGKKSRTATLLPWHTIAAIQWLVETSETGE
jgi:hypothetical protein